MEWRPVVRGVFGVQKWATETVQERYENKSPAKLMRDTARDCCEPWMGTENNYQNLRRSRSDVFLGEGVVKFSLPEFDGSS